MRRRTALLAIVMAGIIAIGVPIILHVADPAPEPSPRAARESGIAALLDELAAASSDRDFVRPSGPWSLSLPADHGGHPETRAESWTIAAHLNDAEGRVIGVHFSLARFGLRPPEAGETSSAWALRALYRAHVMVVGEGRGGARSEERFSRGAPGVAGHDEDGAEVWLGDWTLRHGLGAEGRGLALSASVAGEPLRLALTPEKPALAMGTDGEAPFRGFAMPRLGVEGTIGAGAERRSVTGLAWLDQLWGELPFPGGPVAYDRLLMQLDQGADISLLRTRRIDGAGLATVEGLLVAGAGGADSLADAVEMEPLARWRPGGGEGGYPVAWEVEGRGLRLRVTPVAEDQLHDFVLPVWSGVVRVEGMRDGRPVSGLGTLQLSGYADR